MIRTACAVVLSALAFAAPAQAPLRLMAPSAHQGTVDAVAIARGGELVATGGSDQRIHLWHLPGARQWRTLAGHAASVTALAFSPDGALLASGDQQGGVRVWRVADGATLCALDNPNDRPDSILAGGQDTRRIGWSGAGEFWAMGNYGVARRWRVQGCAQAARVDAHNGSVRDAVPAGDGWWIASGSDLVVVDAAGKAREKHALGADAVRFLDAPGGGRPSLHLEDGAILALGADGKPGARALDASRPRAVALLPGGWISADSNRELELWRDGAARTLRPLDVPGGEVRRERIGGLSVVAALGDLVVAAGSGGVLALEARTGAVRARVEAPSGRYSSRLAASPDGRWLVQAGVSDPVLWDLSSGRAAGTLKLPTPVSDTGALAFASPSRLLVFDYDRAKRLTILRRFDLASGRYDASRTLGRDASDFVVAPAGDRVYVAQGDGIEILKADDLSPLGRIALGARAERLSIDAKGGMLLASRGNGIALVPLDGGALRVVDAAAFGAGVTAAELSADGGTFWIAAGDRVSAFPVAGGEARWSVPAPVRYGSVLRRSPDGRRVALVGASVTLLDASDGRTTIQRSASSLADGAWLDAASLVGLAADGSLRLWRDAPDALLEARTMERPLGGDCVDPGLCATPLPWLVSTDDGRFDTGDFAGLDELAWYRPAKPLEALPFALFARRGFEPRLLPRTLAGGLPAAREAPPARFDPPRVRIASVGPSKADPASLRVEIEVEAKGGGLASVVLLRDGVRVARVEGAAAKGGRVVVDPVRYTMFSLAEPLRFTAIAYDAEGLQASATMAHRPAFDAKRVQDAPPPMHFLVTIGVNAHDNAAFDLAFAANDARRIGDRLAAALSGASGANRVVRVPLVADDAAKLATKARIREALQVLSGAAPASADPALAGLRRAGPDDTVVISFAGHGFNGEDGEFYLVPSDTGPGSGQRVTPELQKRAIASRELAEWLDGLDAGRAVLVLDACHSAAAVNVRDFVPGPMDSRGLGQLAYDKGLAVLVATQADDVALESDRLQQGLLSYALVAEGLDKGQADFAPRDGRLGLVEWLSFAVGRVPALARQAKAGTLPLAPGSRGLARISAPAAPPPAQTPSLFYFARGRMDATLARVPAR